MTGKGAAVTDSVRFLERIAGKPGLSEAAEVQRVAVLFRAGDRRKRVRAGILEVMRHITTLVQAQHESVVHRLRLQQIR